MVNSRRNPRFVSFRGTETRRTVDRLEGIDFLAKRKADRMLLSKDPLCLLMYQFARRSLE